MKNGVAKRHDIEDFTVLVTDLVEEAQAANLIFLRRCIEGGADALKHFGFGYIEVDEIDGRFGWAVLAVAFEIEVVHRHGAITRTCAQSCKKKGSPGGVSQGVKSRLQSTVGPTGMMCVVTIG